MPDTYGKRQRQTVKARKAAAKDERRIASARRREAIASGLMKPPAEDSWLGEPNPTGLEDLPTPRRDD
ncbi:MAG: hypothetical protein ABR518_03690 [Actinomycetota bacterium]